MGVRTVQCVLSVVSWSYIRADSSPSLFFPSPPQSTIPSSDTLNLPTQSLHRLHMCSEACSQLQGVNLVNRMFVIACECGIWGALSASGKFLFIARQVHLCSQLPWAMSFMDKVTTNRKRQWEEWKKDSSSSLFPLIVKIFSSWCLSQSLFN